MTSADSLEQRTKFKHIMRASCLSINTNAFSCILWNICSKLQLLVILSSFIFFSWIKFFFFHFLSCRWIYKWTVKLVTYVEQWSIQGVAEWEHQEGIPCKPSAPILWIRAPYSSNDVHKHILSERKCWAYTNEMCNFFLWKVSVEEYILNYELFESKHS